MLAVSQNPFDVMFLDGRIVDEDLPLIDQLITEQTVFVLDDFEGIEKGVINLIKLKRIPKLNKHLLIQPASEEKLAKFNLLGHSLMAALIPISMVQLTNQ